MTILNTIDISNIKTEEKRIMEMEMDIDSSRPIRIAIYTRVSTDMQAKDGHSLDAQEQSLRDFCSFKKWTIYKVYRDEGFSAKDMNRPELQNMLSDMKQNLFDIVLVAKLDRLTRNVRNLYEMLEDFKKYKVYFKSANEVFETTTAMGRMFMGIVAQISQWERETIGERVHTVLEHKVKSGGWKGGMLPYGYKVENGKVLHHEDEVETAKYIFDRIKIVGISSICKELNQQNVPTRKGGVWFEKTVQQIVKNAFYAGYQTFGTPELFLSNEIEPIITKEHFDEVQTVLKQRLSRNYRGEKSDHVYLFVGVMRCTHCRGRMNGSIQKGKKSYRCHNQRVGKCSASMIQEIKIDEFVQENFSSILNQFKIQSKKSVSNPKKTLEDFQKKFNHYDYLIEKENQLFRNDRITMDALVKKTDEYLKEKNKIKIEIENLKNAKSDIDKIINEIQKFGDYLTLPDIEKRQVIQLVFEKIYAKSTGRMKVKVSEWLTTVRDYIDDPNDLSPEEEEAKNLFETENERDFKYEPKSDFEEELSADYELTEKDYI
jgi:site-specific DNA recombinase